MDVKGKALWNSVVTIGRSQQAWKNSSTFRFASSEDHLGGIPRRAVITTVGALARLWTSVLNRTRVQNMETLLELVYSRPPGTPLVTITNHMSTLDDPLMWGLKGLPLSDSKLCRWVLAAEDICFKNPVTSYFFRLGKCIPVRRGSGIYQPYMNEALDVLNAGDWLHTFPEGKLSQEDKPMRRLKWGVASLIARANVQPIVLPIAHSGFETMLPEDFFLERRPLVPLCMKHISIVIGEPIVFDVPQLKLTAKAMATNLSRTQSTFHGLSDPVTSTVSSCELHQGNFQIEKLVHDDSAHRALPEETLRGDTSAAGLDDFALNWMYSHMSENMRCALQELVYKARSLNKAGSR